MLDPARNAGEPIAAVLAGPENPPPNQAARQPDAEAEYSSIPIAGTVGFRRPSPKEILFRNFDRFPQNGGYTVEPNKTYKIVVEGRNDAGGVVTAMNDRTYVFAVGAIVDLEAVL